jgi:hypothetical protein
MPSARLAAVSLACVPPHAALAAAWPDRALSFDW